MVEHDKARSTPISLQGLFETGSILHPIMFRVLAEAGEAASPKWRMVGSETAVNDAVLQEHGISGHCDGLIQIWGGVMWNDPCAACDVKTCSPNTFYGLREFEDLSKYSFSGKWADQLYVYAFGHNVPQCCLSCLSRMWDFLWFFGGLGKVLVERLSSGRSWWRRHSCPTSSKWNSGLGGRSPEVLTISLFQYPACTLTCLFHRQTLVLNLEHVLGSEWETSPAILCKFRITGIVAPHHPRCKADIIQQCFAVWCL